MSLRPVLALLLLTECSGQQPLPPIAAGLPSDVRKAEAEFDRRVVQEFPSNTPENAVRSALSAQGFAVGASGAELTRNHFPCTTKWIVRWRSTAGKLTSIRGIYGYICP
jgi:hypothetical protein